MRTVLQSAVLAVSLLFAAQAFSAPQAAAKPVAASANKPAQCRDAKGKFIKCPAAKPEKKTCRDEKGKFVACRT